MITVVGALGWQAIAQTADQSKVHDEIIDLHQLKVGIGEARLAQARLTHPQESLALLAGTARADVSRYDRRFHRLLVNQDGKALLTPFLAPLKQADTRLHATLERLDEAVRTGGTEAARSALVAQTIRDAGAVSAVLDQVHVAASELEGDLDRQEAEIERQLFLHTYALLVLAIFISLAVAAVVTRALTGPISRLARDAQRIAAGEVRTLPSQPGTIKEINQLNAALSAMVHSVGQRLDQEQEVSRAKSAFLGHLSKELRTPLNSVLGFSQMLTMEKRGLSQATLARYASNIEQSGRHILKIINDLLDLARIDAGDFRLDPVPFDLDRMLKDVEAAIRPLADEKQITVVLENSVREPIEADSERIQQILLNLLENAVKFTPIGGPVTVRAHPRRAHVEVAVVDAGVGVAPEDVERIFGQYQKVGEHLSAEPGAGLGLPLAKKLVELHEGEIWVNSRPGQGSTFTFTIPIRPAGNQAA